MPKPHRYHSSWSLPNSYLYKTKGVEFSSGARFNHVLWTVINLVMASITFNFCIWGVKESEICMPKSWLFLYVSSDTSPPCCSGGLFIFMSTINIETDRKFRFALALLWSFWYGLSLCTYTWFMFTGALYIYAPNTKIEVQTCPDIWGILAGSALSGIPVLLRDRCGYRFSITS